MKACIICPNFKLSNIFRLPRRIIFELSKGLIDHNLEVVIISDKIKNSSLSEEIIMGIKVKRINKISTLLSSTPHQIIDEIKHENPDLIFWLIGTTTFLRPFKINDIKIPIIGIYTSPIYNFLDFVTVGIDEILRSIRTLWTHLLGLITPKILIKNALNSKNFDKIIVVSKNTRSKLREIGVNKKKIILLRVGITDEDLSFESPKKIREVKQEFRINDDEFIVTYFGSPLTIRGTDTLVKAFYSFNECVPKSRLFILSRIDHDYEKKYEILLKKLCKRYGVLNSVFIISKYLDKSYLKSLLQISDIIVLPFKLVISDTPLVVLETLALGKALITTNVNGISEIVSDGRGILIPPNDHIFLSETLKKVYNNSDGICSLSSSARQFMMFVYPKWNDVCVQLLKILNKIINNGKL
ncbi:MAG: glycosyltransferase family 4 protein [Candidatus Hodarchaeota archaeon]